MQPLCILLFFSLAFHCVHGSRPQGPLNPEVRAPGTPVEAYILDAKACRDNYRIVTRQVDDELDAVIEIAQKCGNDAIRAFNYTLIDQPLSAFQRSLLILNGYTLIAVNESFYNITWQLPTTV